MISENIKNSMKNIKISYKIQYGFPIMHHLMRKQRDAMFPNIVTAQIISVYSPRYLPTTETTDTLTTIAEKASRKGTPFMLFKTIHSYASE